jgi:peptidoglycan/xylan/chitin deacetylase (PgdA/CDA1 family)
MNDAPRSRPWRYRLATPALFAHRLWGRYGIAPPVEAGGFRILLFHDIPDSAIDAFGRFAETVVRNHGVLTPAEAEACLTGGAPSQFMPLSPRQPCLFTFDDGFISNRKIADVVLGPLGIKALFFVAPGLMDVSPEEQSWRIADTVFDGRVEPENLPPWMRLMTWDEVGELKAAGHTIGSHGMLHRRLTYLAGDQLDWEISEAADRLERRLGEPVPWYAYAFGDIGSISRSALEIIGQRYRFCRSGVRGANTPRTGRLALRADMVDLDAPFDYQKLTVEGGLDRLYREAREHLDLISTPQLAVADSSAASD